MEARRVVVKGGLYDYAVTKPQPPNTENKIMSHRRRSTSASSKRHTLKSGESSVVDSVRDLVVNVGGRVYVKRTNYKAGLRNQFAGNAFERLYETKTVRPATASTSRTSRKLYLLPVTSVGRQLQSKFNTRPSYSIDKAPRQQYQKQTFNKELNECFPNRYAMGTCCM